MEVLPSAVVSEWKPADQVTDLLCEDNEYRKYSVCNYKKAKTDLFSKGKVPFNALIFL